jgi:hypothetical protein
MPVPVSRLANPPTHVASDVELPHGERRPPRDMARAARWWPVVALAAALPMALGAAVADPTRVPLVAASLIFLGLAAVMRSTDRRAARHGSLTAPIRVEDR